MKKFPKSISVLTVGTLIIVAFFRGTVSHVMLIIFFAGWGLFNMRKYIISILLENKRISAFNGKQKKPYTWNTKRSKKNTGNTSSYYKPNWRKRRRFRNGKNKII